MSFPAGPSAHACLLAAVVLVSLTAGCATARKSCGNTCRPAYAASAGYARPEGVAGSASGGAYSSANKPDVAAAAVPYTPGPTQR